MNCAGTAITPVQSPTNFWTFAVNGIGGSSQSCASVTVDKRGSPVTTIISKGYNVGSGLCASSNPNRIERELEVSYSSSASVNLALGKPVAELVSGDQNYDTPASNLTDGDQSTMAYPANYSFSYEVDLGSLTAVSQINATVKNFGYNSPNVYITGWQIQGTNNLGQLVTIGSGGTPSSQIITVFPAFQMSKIRVSAQSTSNWIGIYELSAY
jgi:hypothetical protein